MSLLRALFLPVSVVLLFSAALAVPLPVFLERPGELVSLGDHVDIQAANAGEIDGDFLLTLVNLRRATTAGLVVGLLDADTQFLLVEQITRGLDDDTYFDRQRALFAHTADVAAALGLQAAGVSVDFAEPVGAVVARVVPGAPAEGALQPGDVVTAVDGEQVHSAGGLVRAVRRSQGEPMQLQLRRGEDERRVTVSTGPIPGMEESGLGVQVTDLPPDVDLPVPVVVDTGPIGGPSAGLMIALTVFDMMADDDLANGRRIAGTGSIDMHGQVQPIGGIALKVVASHRAGVDVFLAPAEQYEDAAAAVPEGSDLQVVGVGTVEEALEALADAAKPTAAGGRLPAASAVRGSHAAPVMLLQWAFPLRAAPGG